MRAFPLPLLSSGFLLTFALGACSSDPAGTTTGTPATTAGTGGNASGGQTVTGGGSGTVVPTAGTAGMSMGGMNSGTSGSGGTAGVMSVAGSGGAGTAGTAGSGGTAGAGGGSPVSKSLGCGMNPGATDSTTVWVEHDIDVTGVDPAFVTMYAANAGKTYNWTHRNYYLRLPTNYDPGKAYPVSIGASGCGGPETVGSEGGYNPLGTTPGETQAIQVALSYVLSSAANPDCGGAVFADDFPNSPEVQYVAAVVKDVESKYCSDSSKVFESGYSSGAFESISMGCADSDILRAYGVQIGGGLRGKSPMPCKGPIAAMFVVGNQDNENPIGPKPAIDSLGTGAARDEVLKRNGCTDTTTKVWDAAYPLCQQYTSCPAKYPVVWCPVDADHGSPTGNGAATYVQAGMWKFFSTLP